MTPYRAFATSIQPEIGHNSQVSGEWDDEVICHNDAAPYNIVFQDEVPVALIDFDLVARSKNLGHRLYAVHISPAGKLCNRLHYRDIDTLSIGNTSRIARTEYRCSLNPMAYHRLPT